MSVSWSVVAQSERADRLVVIGSVDLSAEQPLVDAVTHLVDGEINQPDLGGRTCEIDLSGVSFIDSSGVRALMRLVRSFGPRVTVGPVSDSVRRVLEIAGVREWLSTAAADRTEATSADEPTTVGDAPRGGRTA